MNHGTRSMYNTSACRCAPCRAANSAYMVQYRARALKSGRVPHGTDTGYEYGCRCTSCRHAHTEGARRARTRKSANAAVAARLANGGAA